MAVNLRQRVTLQQAKAQRLLLPRYLKLDGGRYLIIAALLLSLLGLLTLGQTGRLATKGYELARLQTQQTTLLRQHSTLQLRISEAQSLTKIEKRAIEMGLRPVTPEQTRYVTAGPEAAISASTTTDAASNNAGASAPDAAQPTNAPTAEPVQP